jgi:small subunit ribosomal protein S10
MASQIIRINLWSFDSACSTPRSVDRRDRPQHRLQPSPVRSPLPTRIQRFTVKRSPNGDKKSREQFEMRSHKRLVDLVDPPQKTLDELQSLDLPAGVYVEIKLTS